MEYKLKKPITSPVGAKQKIEAITMRELEGDDVVEGFAAWPDKNVKAVKVMVVRCSGLLAEEIGKLKAADYIVLANHVQEQLGHEGSADPKDESAPSKP